jgi:GTP cyclohydrolase I
LAANGGFLLGNAHRCGIPTDRVVRTGQLIRQLIAAAAKDSQEQEAATERFAKFFMATAVPDKADGKLAASCEMVSSEFEKLESHHITAEGSKPDAESKSAAGSTTRPKFRLGDGE